MHGLFITGTTGEWFSLSPDERRLVAETAIDQVAGRATVVIGCTSLTAKQAVELGRHAIAAGADGVGSTAPPYSKTYPDETVRYFQDMSDGIDAPADGLQLAPRDERRHRPGPRSADRGHRQRRRDQGQHAGPRAVLRDGEARREQLRVFGPFMSVAGLEFLLEHGGDGFIGGGSLWGAPDAEFWEAVWRGDVEVAREHARRTDELFPKLWLPGGWGGHFGAYQSQLKALMKMLGQPGGEVRLPRLPVTDKASLQQMHEILVEIGLLARAGGGCVTTFMGVDHVGVGVGDADEADRVLRPARRLRPRAVRLHRQSCRASRPSQAARRRARVGNARVEQRDAGRPGSGEARPGARRRRAAACAGGPGLGRGRRVRDLPARPRRAGGTRRARRSRLRVADGADERRRAADGHHARHRVRRRSVGDEARDDRVDGAVAFAAGTAARRRRQPRRVRRDRHGTHARVLRAARVHASCSSSRSSSSTRWRPGSRRRGTTRQSARAAHDDADARAGRGDRAGRARPAGTRLPRNVGTSRADGLRHSRRQHRRRGSAPASDGVRAARRAAVARRRLRRVALRRTSRSPTATTSSSSRRAIDARHGPEAVLARDDHAVANPGDARARVRYAVDDDKAVEAHAHAAVDARAAIPPGVVRVRE